MGLRTDRWRWRTFGNRDHPAGTRGDIERAGFFTAKGAAIVSALVKPYSYRRSTQKRRRICSVSCREHQFQVTLVTAHSVRGLLR